ncbi:MAG: hypothetical protein ACI93P_002411 [bacterium]|jgi:hypothetical protein
MELRQSTRSHAKMKMALQAPSGAGKSMSALLLAKGLTNDNLSKVAIIDTENKSSNLYAHLGNYNVLSMSPPFSPEKYIEAIDICLKGGMEVIIIDSISHCWDYLLEYHSSMSGNSFTNWGKITPMHNKFINKILQSDAHFIATMRTKQDYVLQQKNGKFVPEKVGLKAVQRDGVDYEMTIVFDIDIKHFAKASKDRTGLFADKPEFIITEGVGRKIKDWCNSGESLQDVKDEIKACTTLEQLRVIYTKNINNKEELNTDFLNQQEFIKQQQMSNLNNFSANGTTNS